MKKYLNLDFEYSLHNGRYEQFPGWFTYHDSYRIKADRKNFVSGKQSICIKTYTKSDFYLMHELPAELVRGKKITLKGFIRTEDLNKGKAGLTINFYDFDDLVYDENPLEKKWRCSGTSGWKQYQISRECSVIADKVFIGAGIKGAGTVWFDNFELYINGKKYEEKEYTLPLAGKDDVKILQKNIIPLRSFRAGRGFKDLVPLKEYIGDSRIVALGEDTHGSSAIFKMKHRLMEFLAAEMGFNIFAIEANMPEAYEVNKYVTEGKGDPKKLIRGMYFWTWYTQEVLDMVKWMRKFNVSGKGEIKFRGFDMQILDKIKLHLRDFLSSTGSAQIKAYNKNISIIDKQLMRYYSKGKSPDKKIINECVHCIRNAVTESKNVYLKEHSIENYEWIQQLCRIVEQSAVIYRDKAMAENIEWILNHEPKGSKMVIWAHNLHITYDNKFMGYYLKKKLGDDYKNIGFALGGGKYTAVNHRRSGQKATWKHKLYPPFEGTIENYFKKAGRKIFFLDMVKNNIPYLDNNLFVRNIGALAQRTQFFPMDVRKNYGAIIYIDNTASSAKFRFIRKKTVK